MRPLPLLLLVCLLASTLCAQSLHWSDPQWLRDEEPADVLPQPKRLPEPPVPPALAGYEHPTYAEHWVAVSPKGAALHGPFLAATPYLTQFNWRQNRFEPAERDGRAIHSEVVMHLIYNPASAGTRGAEATPRLLDVVPPRYPQTNSTGRPSPVSLMMNATIDAAGVVQGTSAVDAGADKRFVAAADEALRRWRFAPARKAGQPVAGAVQVPVLFLPQVEENPGSLGTPPKVTRQNRPIYPFAMRLAEINGEVLLRFVVTREGRVRDAYVVHSTHPGFDEAAVDAVEKWEFEPGYKEGRAVHTRMQVPIVFEIAPGGRPPFRIKRPKSFPETLPEIFHYDHPPELVGFAVPNYPLEALRGDQNGVVRIGFTVGPDGHVLTTRSLSESAPPELVGAAVAAVEAFKFKPPSRKGEPCFAMAAFEFDFRTSGNGDVPVTPETHRLLRILEKTPEKLAKLNELDGPPKPGGRKPPVVPTGFRERDDTGEAMIEFIIDRRGFARLPRIVSATDPAFGYAAMQAISTWRFEPPRQNGRPVDALVRIPVKFNNSPSPAP